MLEKHSEGYGVSDQEFFPLETPKSVRNKVYWMKSISLRGKMFAFVDIN